MFCMISDILMGIFETLKIARRHMLLSLLKSEDFGTPVRILLTIPTHLNYKLSINITFLPAFIHSFIVDHSPTTNT